MQIHTHPHGEAHVILTLDGRLDLASAPDLRAAIATTIHRGPRRLVLDLHGVPFIDSTGLGALLGGYRAARDAGGDLRIARTRPEVLDILSLMRVDRLLEPYDTLDAALAND